MRARTIPSPAAPRPEAGPAAGDGTGAGTPAEGAQVAVGGPPGVAPGTGGGVLARCRGLVRPALVEAVGTLHPWTGEMAAYAFGWSRTDGTPAPGASEGKGLRQALAVLGAEAAGSDGRVAVAGAVAVELVHAFSLLHDDIMDGDAVRRQRATVWKAYGTGPAVLAGDALFALAVQALAEAPGPHTGAAVRRLCDTLTALMRGQSEDLCFERRPWTGPDAVRLDAYRAMAEDKTGALLGCAAALGAQSAGAPAGTVAALDAAGRHLGVAFQAVDDLLGIWGDPAVTGKPVYGDLRQRKKTFPVLAALERGGAPARELAALLESDRPMAGATVTRVAALVEAAGGRAAALTEARDQLAAARSRLHTAPLAPAAVRDLEALLAVLADRAV